MVSGSDRGVIIYLMLLMQGIESNPGPLKSNSKTNMSIRIYLLEMKERNFVCRANRRLLVKCYDNEKVKSPYNWVIFPLNKPQVANQQKKLILNLLVI